MSKYNKLFKDLLSIFITISVTYNWYWRRPFLSYINTNPFWVERINTVRFRYDFGFFLQYKRCYYFGKAEVSDLYSDEIFFFHLWTNYVKTFKKNRLKKSKTDPKFDDFELDGKFSPKTKNL